MVVVSQILKLFYCIYKPAGNDSAGKLLAPMTATHENLSILLSHTLSRVKTKEVVVGGGGWNAGNLNKMELKRTLVMRGHIPLQTAQHVLPRPL